MEGNAETQMMTKQSRISAIKFLLVAGGGLFGDGYLNTTIGLVVPMISYIYFSDVKGGISAVQGDEIKGAFSIGMIAGQLIFGILGDTLGRHRVYGKECLFAIFGTLMVILLPWRGLSQQGIVGWLAVFRVVSGMGAGGDYPMTCTLAAEHAVIGTRARLILLAFALMAVGQLAAAIVFIVLLAAFKTDIQNDINRLEWVWRLLLGLGIVPACLTLYARMQMKETKPYEKYVATETSFTDRTKRGLGDQFRDFKEYFSDRRHAKVLFATAMSWFLYDIAYYGVGLNQSIVLKDIGFSGGSTPFESLWKTAIGNIIVVFAGNLPGVFVGVFLPDLMGRRNLQFYSALTAMLLYAVWAGVQSSATSGGLIALFTLSQFVLGAGPNITTFLIPVEMFPTRLRGSGHGISAASGKLGAVLTSFAFGTAVQNMGIRGVLGLFTGIMFLLAIVSLLIPEPKGFTLEEIENDALYNKAVASGSTSSIEPNGKMTDEDVPAVPKQLV